MYSHICISYIEVSNEKVLQSPQWAIQKTRSRQNQLKREARATKQENTTTMTTDIRHLHKIEQANKRRQRNTIETKNKDKIPNLNLRYTKYNTNKNNNMNEEMYVVIVDTRGMTTSKIDGT
jgi:hypothetical protein